MDSFYFKNIVFNFYDLNDTLCVVKYRPSHKIVKGKDAKFIKLNAFEDNVPAIDLYKKAGFKEYSIYYMKPIE